MSLCASCGLQLPEGVGLCSHHHNVYGDDWATGNRIMCDFFHRGKVPPRIAVEDREFLTQTNLDPIIGDAA